MLVFVNHFGPEKPKLNRERELDDLIKYAAEENIFMFWSQEELDFFNGYALIQGKQFPMARLWRDRPFEDHKRFGTMYSFITIPQAKVRKLP